MNKYFHIHVAQTVAHDTSSGKVVGSTPKEMHELIKCIFEFEVMYLLLPLAIFDISNC